MQTTNNFEIIKKRGKDIKDCTIVEKNVTNEFTFTELLQAMASNAKELKTLEAQLELDQAAIMNVKKHYPVVLKLTPEQLVACSLYGELTAKVGTIKTKIKLFKEAERRDNARKTEILKTIPELNESK